MNIETLLGEIPKTKFVQEYFHRLPFSIYDYLRARLLDSLLWRQRLPVNGAVSAVSSDELISHYRELFGQLADNLAKTLRDEQFVREFLARGESES